MSRMDVLAGWLARSNWNVDEAAWLLTGFCPEQSEWSDNQESDWYRLPGTTLHKPSSLDDAKWRDADLQGQIERKMAWLTSVVPGGSEPPKMHLERARKGNYLPPWIKAAQDDPTCNQLLPPKLRVRKRTAEEANSQRRRVQLANDPKQRLLNCDARRIFDQVAATNFENHRIGSDQHVNISAVARTILDELQELYPSQVPASDRAIKNRVKTWLEGREVEPAELK